MENNHHEWKQLVSAYFDGELSAEERTQVNNHLVDCPACQKYLKELQSLSQGIKKLKTEKLSPDLEQRLIQTMTSGKGKSMEKFNWQHAGKVLVVFFLVGAVYFSSQAYLKRGVQGRLRSAADDIGEQYAAGNVSVAKREPQKIREARVRDASQYTLTRDSAEIVKYEPYYSSSSYQLARGSIETAGTRRQNIDGLESADWGGIEEKQVIYPHQPVYGNREQYDLINENEFLNVTENPLSTFSIDVDTASYANVRRFLNSNQMPPRDSVRIEEMINYFNYDYPQPRGNEPFSITLEHGTAPWNPSHQLVLVGLQGKILSERQTPDSNLVFLIDVSGSMNDANKLPLLKESLKLMVQQLRPQERVSLVVYAGAAGVVLDSTPGYDKHTILSAIDRLQSGGSTAGGQGIRLAYQIAKKNFIRNGNNRVILATDGDFNVGVSSDSELVQIIEEERKHDIFLTVLGFGTGNLQDAKMEKIANKGNGNYYYIDSINEGRKVLVDELGSTIFTIAKDVKIQIEFNPTHVKSYRLIGYENCRLAKEDFNDDTKDAGELGAGHTVTALYEIIPAGSWENTGGNVDPLKYQSQEPRKPLFSSPNEMMTVKLRYKEPTGDTSRLITKVLKDKGQSMVSRSWHGIDQGRNLNLASAVAQFGMLLRDSKFKGYSSYSSVTGLLRNGGTADKWGYTAELQSLVEKASILDPRHAQPPAGREIEILRPKGHCPTEDFSSPEQGYNQKNKGN